MGGSLLKRTSAACACGNRYPSGTCNSLSKGKNPPPHCGQVTHVRSTSTCWPPASRPSARLQYLTALLAYEPRVDFTGGYGTHLHSLQPYAILKSYRNSRDEELIHTHHSSI